MPHKIFKVVLISMFLVSCAQSSGVLKLGPDTYTVSVHAAPARGGESGAKRLAVTEANQYCSSLGKEILVSNISSHRSTHFPGGTVDITFSCFDKGDADLVRPTYQKPPDVVIEDRRN